jgi:RNA recognition motif-containing protein
MRTTSFSQATVRHLAAHQVLDIDVLPEAKHRGFAFVTYGAAADAQDAIDNMDLNELKGRVVKVNLAKPMKGLLSAPVQNRASALIFHTGLIPRVLICF